MPQPGNYPKTLEVLKLKEGIEEGLDELVQLNEELGELTVDEGNDSLPGAVNDILTRQNRLVSGIRRDIQLAQVKLAVQGKVGEERRATTGALLTGLKELEGRLDSAMKKKAGHAVRAETGEELETSTRRKDSEYLQLVLYLGVLIVVSLLCAQSSVSPESQSHENVIMAVVLAAVAYYLVVNYIL